MKTVKLFWVTALLVVATLILAIKGVSVKKEAEIMVTQVTAMREPAATKATFSVSPADMLRAKENVEAYAKANDIPVTVKISGTEITVTSAPEPTVSTNDGSPAKEQVKEDKAVTLSNFYNEETGKGLLNFLSMISDMKYHLTYKNVCIGVDCNAGIEMTLTCDSKGKTEAPAASPGQTPPSKNKS